MKKREHINDILNNLSLDALFISNQDTVAYLTGFVGFSHEERKGFLLICKNKFFLFTFPTYFGLYQYKSKDIEVINILVPKTLTDYLSQICIKEDIKNIGFEENHLTVAELSSLQTKVSLRGLKARGFPYRRNPVPKAPYHDLTIHPPAKSTGLSGTGVNNTHGRLHWHKTNGAIDELRIIKDEEEIKYIRKASKITDTAFNYIREKISKNQSEKELSLLLEFFIKNHADDVAFSPIVAFDENSAIPHHLPTSSKKLTGNNLILLDFGAKVNNYCSDMTRIVFLGSPNDQQIKVYNVVLEAQKRALEILKADIICSQPDEIAQKYIKLQGFPPYFHKLGHGVGIAIHEQPKLKIGIDEKLRQNMVVTVEPGIYLPGKFGIRIEDLVVIKEKGVEILSRSPKSLIII